MASSRRPSRPTRVLTALLLLGLTAFAGCESYYDDEILYPLRKDWIVSKSLENMPERINPPGVLPLAALDGQRGMPGFTEVDLKKMIDPRLVLQNRAVSEEMMLALRDLAGRPRYPKIDTSDDEVNARLEVELKLDRKTLTDGSILYRKHCMHCHGLAGDGKGPTGLWINPHPRDFRQGQFKYTSSSEDEGQRKPRRDDLRRILHNGIEGSAMPSFALLKAEDHEALIAYVTHLSIRGEAEIETLKKLAEDPKLESQPDGEQTIVDQVRKWATLVGRRWLDAPTKEIKPIPERMPKPGQSESDRLASAARGYAYFNGAGGCTQCHVNLGRDAQLRYDNWGTIVKPRNLTANQYGGGRRPIDLFWRLHAGIPPAGMPMVPIDAKVSAEDREGHIWDMVAFLRVLPYPEERAKLRQSHKILLD